MWFECESSWFTKYAKTMPAMSSVLAGITLTTENLDSDHQRDEVSYEAITQTYIYI